MPELRKDPVLGRWIIIAQERAKRPTDFVVAEGEKRTEWNTRFGTFSLFDHGKDPNAGTREGTGKDDKIFR